MLIDEQDLKRSKHAFNNRKPERRSNIIRRGQTATAAALCLSITALTWCLSPRHPVGKERVHGKEFRPKREIKQAT